MPYNAGQLCSHICTDCNLLVSECDCDPFSLRFIQTKYVDILQSKRVCVCVCVCVCTFVCACERACVHVCVLVSSIYVFPNDAEMCHFPRSVSSVAGYVNRDSLLSVDSRYSRALRLVLLIICPHTPHRTTELSSIS